jgi:hypothetical protein
VARQRGAVCAGEGPSRSPDTAAAPLLAAGHVFGYHWHDALWVPLFQIDATTLGAAAGPQHVVTELGPGFDGWSLAQWFVRPNSSLDGRLPLDCMSASLPDVLAAAREDRYVAGG